MNTKANSNAVPVIDVTYSFGIGGYGPDLALELNDKYLVSNTSSETTQKLTENPKLSLSNVAPAALTGSGPIMTVTYSSDVGDLHPQAGIEKIIT